MMAEIEQIVQIQITRETTPVSTASFQIPLILATHTKFAERTRTYTDFDAIATDFDSGDKVYQIAQRLFGQQGARIPSVVVGRRQVDGVTGSINPVTNSTEYFVTINDKKYTVTSDATALATEITALLKAQFDLDPVVGISFTDVLGTFTVSTATPGVGFAVGSSSNITIVDDASTETYVDALDAVINENDTWYALVCESHVEDDVKALAAAIQTRRKIYGTSTAVPAVATTATTDIASFLDGGNYGRTFCIYLPTADTEYPEAAWIGSQLAYTPGNNTWNFKRGALVTKSNLNDTQRVNLRNKNCNMYTTVAGVDVFQDGVMADGLFVDLKKVA